MPRNAFCSFANFLRGFIVLFLPNVFQKYSSYRGDFTLSYFIILSLFAVVVGIYLKLKYDEIKFQVAIRSYFLGLVFSCGIFGLACSLTSLGGDASDGGRGGQSPPLPLEYAHFACVASLYLMCLSVFHFTEYAVFALVNPESVTIDSFLLDHSFAYKLAMVASCVEFALEIHLTPEMKRSYIPIVIGITMICCGDILRKVAMVTASVNFDHYIQYTKRPGHTLVTNGVYAWSRHPSYVGWFYWSIGTQILLSNPVCGVLYVLAGWQFFSERICSEELTLLKFFGVEYHRYQNKVPIRLPFIKGYDSSFMKSVDQKK